LPQEWTTSFGYLADAATIAGLVTSVLAWRRASGAEQAAKEARAAIRQANAAESFQALRTKAREFLLSVQRDQRDVAASFCAELLSETIMATRRWSLSSEAADRLQRSVKYLKLASAVFAEAAAEPTGKGRLLEAAHEMLEALSDATGKILQRADKVD
jgi:hypothetical protein